MPSIVTYWIVSFLSFAVCSTASSSSAGSRYSFSLTTFDPAGKLDQVEYAVQAAALGGPIAVVALEHQRVLLAAPQRLPSPLMLDDGTARFTRISPEIVLAHTGLSADGRKLALQAQNLALNYRYSYDEDVSVDYLLQGLSLMFQEYTMKPGCRPFGCTLVVAHLPRHGRPQLFRMDPSGSISALEDCCVVNGKGHDTDELKKRLEEAAVHEHNGDKESSDSSSLHAVLAEWFHEELSRQAKKNREESVPEKIVVASVSSNGRFQQGRYGYSRQKDEHTT